METLLLTGRSGDVLARFAEPLVMLTEQERRRAAAVRLEIDRDSFVAAHLLARICAARLLGGSVGEVTLEQHCSYCSGPHGRPKVVQAPELAVSWSHTRGQVAAMAGPGPLGVDIEIIPARNSNSLPRRVLAPAEVDWMLAAPDPQAAFLSLWARKEVLIKIGILTLVKMSTVDLVGDAGELVETWEGYRLTGWRRGPVIGACAIPYPVGRVDNSRGPGRGVRHPCGPTPQEPPHRTVQRLDHLQSLGRLADGLASISAGVVR